MELVNKEAVENCKCKDVCISQIQSYESNEIHEMRHLMVARYGIGLAAPQVGIYRKFFIMRYGNETISCYNPIWKPKSDKKALSKESCLTYPNKATFRRPEKNILRYKIIIAEFYNSNGEPVQLKLRGKDAIVFQHETDYLSGITIFNKKG